MRPFRTLVALIASLTVASQAELIGDADIGTWTQGFSGWDMEASQFHYIWTTVPANIRNDKVLGLRVMIYSDPSQPEVFDLTRRAGHAWNANLGTGSRSGGNSTFHLYDNGQLFVELDRGPCPRHSDRPCKSGYGVDGFFAGTSAGAPRQSQSFYWQRDRTFYNTAKIRGVLKIDYACVGCATAATQVMWKKMGAWNMAGQLSPGWRQADLGVAPASVVDYSAAVHSDPVAGKIQVDDLAHQSAMNGSGGANDVPGIRGRGGYMWYGYGCGGANPRACKTAFGPTSFGLRLFAGPYEGSTMSFPTNYRGTSYIYDGNDLPLTYQALNANRGWVRMEYSGPKSAVKVPYAMLSRALNIGPWNMTGKIGHSIPFSPFNIAVNRITRFSTTIRSDYSTCLPACLPGITSTNFHRTEPASGVRDGLFQYQGGGMSYVDEAQAGGSIAFKHTLKPFPLNAPSSFYTNSSYAGGGNRGWVLIDYLAGSCEQGLNNFAIRAIPGRRVGDCTGTEGTFTMEGAGNDIFWAKDEFAFAYRSGSGDKDLQIKIESMGNTSSWAKAGIMFRSGLQPEAMHASMFMTPGQGAQFTWRSQTAPNSDRTPTNTLKAPYYLRVRKVGNTFTAFYRQYSTSAWTQAGVPQTLNAFGSGYYYGLAQSSNSPALNRATFSGMTGF